MVDNSKQAYSDKYLNGYGVMYPEGHVIRFYEHFWKWENKRKGGRLLDFGCGNGTHMQYFQSKGFEVCGVDIIAEAVEMTNQRCGGGLIN